MCLMRLSWLIQLQVLKQCRFINKKRNKVQHETNNCLTRYIKTCSLSFKAFFRVQIFSFLHLLGFFIAYFVLVFHTCCCFHQVRHVRWLYWV